MSTTVVCIGCERATLAIGRLPLCQACTAKQFAAYDGAHDEDEGTYRWTVTLVVTPRWVADGFDLTPSRAHTMLARTLPHALNSELRAVVRSRPSQERIRVEQGYKPASFTATDVQRAHCGRDPAAIGCCGGTDDTCSCECTTCEDPR